MNETLQSGNEDEDNMGLDVIHNVRNSQEGGARGEDWEEVRFEMIFIRCVKE